MGAVDRADKSMASLTASENLHHVGRSRRPRCHLNADIRAIMAVAAQMSAMGGCGRSGAIG